MSQEELLDSAGVTAPSNNSPEDAYDPLAFLSDLAELSPFKIMGDAVAPTVRKAIGMDGSTSSAQSGKAESGRTSNIQGKSTQLKGRIPVKGEQAPQQATEGQKPFTYIDVPQNPFTVVDAVPTEEDIAKIDARFAERTKGISPSFGFKAEMPQQFDFDRPAKELEARLKEIDERAESESMAAAKKAFQESQTRFNEALQAVEEYKPDNQGPFKTFGSKIMAGISIALGEAARGFRGGQGENIGLTLVNQTIDREIQRQRDEYSRLKDRVNFADNLYAKAFGILKNEELAEKTVKEALERRAMNLFDSATSSMQANMNQENFRVQLTNQINANKAELRAKGAEIQMQQALAEKKSAYDRASAKQKAIQEAQVRQEFSPNTRRDAAQEVRKLNSAQSNVRNALESLKKYKLKRQENPDEQYLSDTFKRVIANQETEGIVDFLKKDVFLDFEGDDKDLVQFANRIKQIAFGLASQNQSSSSISNKDVGIFITLLADPLVSMQEVESYLTFMADQLAADAVYNQAIAKNHDPEAAQAYQIKAMQSRGYKMDENGVFLPKSMSPRVQDIRSRF